MEYYMGNKKKEKITDSGRKIFKGTVVFYCILDND